MHVHEAQAAARRKLMCAARLALPPRGLPPVWFMTDPVRTPDPAHIAARLPRGWGVIFRPFGAEDRLSIGRGIAAACRQRGVILLVAGDPALARQLGAQGLHWPERMLTSRAATGLATASAHSRRALVAASRRRVEAAIVSSVFTSRSASADRAMGALKFRLLVRSATLPVYALGGVGPANAARVFSAGGKRAAGFAAIEAIVQAFG
jgi:thiamine-phosphate pyrophosphorylase